MITRKLITRIDYFIEALRQEFPKEYLETVEEKLKHFIDFACFFDPTQWIKRHEDAEKLLEQVVKLKDLLYP